MNRSILLAFAVCCSCSSATIADDYLLRVDAIGYVDEPTSEIAPKETTFRSIEVVARPEAAFHGKVNDGKESLLVAGKLLPAECGGFHLQIRYIYSIDTGISVPTADGGRKSLPDRTVIETNISIAVGDTVTLGSFETTITDFGKPERHSSTRYVLVLAEYEPTDD